MPPARIVEIDGFRGIAIILMIIFHTVFDLAYFYNWPIDYLHGFWYYQGKSSAILFMFVSGISSTLSRRPIVRGLSVFGAGMLITAVTYLYNPAMYIQFGILHLLGLSMLLAPWMKKLSPCLLILTGTALIALGNWCLTLTSVSLWLLPLGIKPADFVSLDYYPLLPWLSVILYGMAAGKLLYADKKSLLPLGGLSSNILSYLGRHSLLIYLIHQPILLTILFLLFS